MKKEMLGILLIFSGVVIIAGQLFYTNVFLLSPENISAGNRMGFFSIVGILFAIIGIVLTSHNLREKKRVEAGLKDLEKKLRREKKEKVSE